MKIINHFINEKIYSDKKSRKVPIFNPAIGDNIARAPKSMESVLFREPLVNPLKTSKDQLEFFGNQLVSNLSSSFR